MDSYVLSFEDFLIDNEKSTNTVESYESDIKQFLSFIDKENVLETNKKDVQDFKDYLYKNGISVKTINRKLVAISQFIKFLNSKYNARIDFTIKREKQQKQEYLNDMLTKEDFQNMVTAAKKKNDMRAVTIFYTLYYTGMRVSEMLQLKINDIKKDVVLIRGKGNKYREVLIPLKLKAIWNKYSKVRYENTDYLFSGQRGPINRQTVHNIIKYYAKLAGIKAEKAHAHNFRHLYCLNLIDHGVGIDTIADLAGHSNIDTTRIYTRRTKNDLFQTINQL